MNQSKQTILTENLEISGKDGNVKCSSMQKHLPETDVLFIKTKSNHFILCQANHPLYVKSNEEVVEKQADKLKAGTDHLWIDNTIAHNGNSEKPSVQPKDLADFIFHSGYDTLNKDDFAAKYRPFLRGECSENLRFEPDFINYDFYWVLDFIERIYENIQNSVFYCRSYILASQIKLLCDRAEFDCKVSPIMQGNDLYFIIHVAYSDLDGVFIKDWNMVDQIYRIENYDKFVYDIKTDTNEFMMNCVQNHNSFHSGGAANLKKTDIIGELKKTVESNQESNLESWFKQVDTSLYLTQEICSIELDKSVYSKSGIKIKIENDQIQIPVGYFRIHIRDIYMDSTIENPTVLYIHDFANVSDNGKTLTINYVKNDKIMSVETVILEPENIATMLDGIVGGKSPFKTPEDLYKKMFNFLSPLAGFDSVHLETIVGNVLRNKKSPQYPARIKEPYEYRSVSIKKLPMVQSWSLGLAFEDIGKSITYGLISDRQPASSIEKVMFGEPMSDLAVKRLKELKKR